MSELKTKENITIMIQAGMMHALKRPVLTYGLMIMGKDKEALK